MMSDASARFMVIVAELKVITFTIKYVVTQPRVRVK